MKQDLYLSVSVCRHLDIRATDEIPREKYRHYNYFTYEDAGDEYEYLILKEKIR